jgi:hypothetical protein
MPPGPQTEISPASTSVSGGPTNIPCVTEQSTACGELWAAICSLGPRVEVAPHATIPIEAETMNGTLRIVGLKVFMVTPSKDYSAQ